jgi:serine/threonine protein kinase/Tol biopolymer transport system component
MPLTSGTRLGAYEITGPLGAGGMGEVYRARDTRLDRTVAIKILPASLATDPYFHERFDREARVISQLTHPHICVLYDVGQQDGVDFLVMEYLEGTTLAARLEKGALPLDQTLQYAIQIADALDKAHRKGIVHRDLKPGNIMLTASGAKLLDFGLAKRQPEGAAAGLSLGATVSRPLTGQGTILGTPQYMAPEQVEGRDADARSDIFAFGAIVYEVTTGRRAFEGTSAASVMAAILEREPPPISTIQPLTPRALDRVVTRCLAKGPDSRWQSAADLEDELRWIAAGGTAVGPLEPRGRSAPLAWILLTIAVLTIVALSLIHFRQQPASNPEARLELTIPATREPLHFAISPDGEHLVFVASGDGSQRLWHRPLAAVTARPLDGTEGAEYPFWSPDSRAVGFFASGQLKRIDIAGGPSQVLADAASGRGGTWNRDGMILFTPTNASGLFVVPASPTPGGKPQPVTTLDQTQGNGSHRFPQFLPDGRHFLFFAQGKAERQGIYLGSLDSTDRTRLTPAEAAGTYAEPGALVFVQQNALVVRHLDLARAMLTGPLVTVADQVRFDTGINLAGFSVSAAGRLVYLGGGAERRRLTWFDRNGEMKGVAGEPDASSLLSPVLSPDGRLIAVARTIQGNQDIWVIDNLRGGETRITTDPANDQVAAWSPDGARIVFSSNRRGIFDLFLKPSTGTGAEELLLESAVPKVPMDWSRDGRFVLYQYGDGQKGWDLAALPMTGDRSDRKPIVVASGPFEERGGQFSRDGRWVAYQSNESGRFEIYVQSFPDPGIKSRVSIAGGTDARWRPDEGPDGQELYFLAPDGTLMAAAVRASGLTFDPGTPMALFKTRMVVGGNANLEPQYAVSGDGRFLINVPDETSSAAPLTVIMNWNPHLTP